MYDEYFFFLSLHTITIHFLLYAMKIEDYVEVSYFKGWDKNYYELTKLLQKFLHSKIFF